MLTSPSLACQAEGEIKIHVDLTLNAPKKSYPSRQPLRPAGKRELIACTTRTTDHGKVHKLGDVRGSEGLLKDITFRERDLGHLCQLLFCVGV